VIKSITWIGLAVLSVASLIGLWTLAALNGPVADDGPTGGFLTVAALSFFTAGALLARRQPQRWTGQLVQLVALTSFAGAARLGGLGRASAILGALWLATILLPGLLVLAHPDGVQPRWLRWLLGGAVSATTALSVFIVLAVHGRSGASSTWWSTPTVHQALPVGRTLFAVHAVVVVATLSIMVVVTATRLVQADRTLRRILNPVLLPGLVWALVAGTGELSLLAGPSWALHPKGDALTEPAAFLLQIVPLLSVTAVLAGVAWTGLVLPRLRRTTAGIAIGAQSGAIDVTGYLVRALGDPSVRVAFHNPDGMAAWVDEEGRATTLAVDNVDRAVMMIRHEGVLLGAIEFDASLAAEPDAVELAATGAGLAMDNARLVAVANARTEDARRLTARLVTSSEDARAQLREQLDDGPLRELEDIETALANGGDLTVAADRLQGVAADVRNISHGLFPPELAHAGLAAALPDAHVTPRRFAPAIEITAFLAVYGDPGARITDEPGRLIIDLSVPPRRSGLLDRVEVLGGTVEGTTVTLPVTG
jgi:hypothetical protein